MKLEKTTINQSPSRREFLSRASGGFGAVAFAGLCGELQGSELQAAPVNPLAARSGHYAAKADRVIFLYSTGGTSHIDTFNHRPQLIADHGKSFTASRWLNKPGEFNRFLIKPRYAFNQYGQSGTWVSDLFPNVGFVIDDVCVCSTRCTARVMVMTKRPSQRIQDRHSLLAPVQDRG